MLIEFGVALVAFILVGGSLFYLYLTWHFDYWLKRGIPGPQPKALFGTFPGTITHKRNFIYDLDEIYSEFKGRHRFVGVFMTRNPQLLILDPLLAKEILIKNFKCFQDNESSKWMDRQLEPISGNNPFVLPGAEWKEKRAEIVPGLTLSKVKGMYPLIANSCEKFGNYLTKEIEKGITCFDAKEFSLRYTSEVVADVVWGIEAGSFNADHPQDCTFLRMSKRMIAQTFYAFTYFFLIGIFPWIRRIFSVRFFPPSTDSYFLQLAQVAGNMRRAMSSSQQGAKRQDFLQHLLDLRERKGLTDTAVVAHMLTFLFDGFETSATLISHCLLLLARHPEAQQKLRLQIQAQENLLEDFDGLMKLPYLEQCIAETLRIFTPLPFMSKICTESCWLEQGDGSRLQLNKGDVCLISLHSFHHDEHYFEQPECFKPERFNAAGASENDVVEGANGGDGDGGFASADGTKRFKDLGVYMPFGDGPRICLGMKFGLAQSKAAIVEIIKTFELTVNERTRSDNWQAASGFITGLDGGIYLNLQPIK